MYVNPFFQNFLIFLFFLQMQALSAWLYRHQKEKHSLVSSAWRNILQFRRMPLRDDRAWKRYPSFRRTEKSCRDAAAYSLFRKFSALSRGSRRRQPSDSSGHERREDQYQSHDGKNRHPFSLPFEPQALMQVNGIENPGDQCPGFFRIPAPPAAPCLFSPDRA